MKIVFLRPVRIISLSKLFFKFSVCTRHAPPIIDTSSMGNTIALMGQDVDFICKVDNLGRHMVSF